MPGTEVDVRTVLHLPRLCRCRKDSTEHPRHQHGIDITIRINFLGSGAARHLTLFEDGINAHHQGMDYRVREMTVRNGDVITVHMARNGGFAAQIK